MPARAFLSYAHSDDENSDGFITGLAQALKRKYQLLSGEEFELFVDRDEANGIQWGEEWRSAIDSNLANALFFIPIVTPTYLMRPECRREFEEFQRAAKAGRQERLILPVLLAEILNADQKKDEIAIKAAELQWVDWSELHIASPQSAEYRAAVHRMVKRLLAVQGEIDSAIESGLDANSPAVSEGTITLVTTESVSITDAAELGEEGALDKVARAEELIQSLQGKIEKMTAGMNGIAKAMGQAAPELKSARSFTRQLVVFNELSKTLSPTVDDYSASVKEYADTIIQSDPGIRELFRMARESESIAASRVDSDAVRASIHSIVELAERGIDAAEAASQFLKQVDVLENRARSLRPTMRKMRTATVVLMSTVPIFKTWIALGESVGTRPDLSAAPGNGADTTTPPSPTAP